MQRKITLRQYFNIYGPDVKYILFRLPEEQ